MVFFAYLILQCLPKKQRLKLLVLLRSLLEESKILHFVEWQPFVVEDSLVLKVLEVSAVEKMRQEDSLVLKEVSVEKMKLVAVKQEDSLVLKELEDSVVE